MFFFILSMIIAWFWIFKANDQIAHNSLVCDRILLLKVFNDFIDINKALENQI